MVATNLSTDDNPNGQNFGNGITGSTDGQWVELTADLSAYSGPTLLGFRYWTDPFVVETGFQVDEVAVTGAPVDGAESDMGWTYDPEGGFHVTNGLESAAYFNAYVAEWRTYWGYDANLRVGPYHFGYLDNPRLQNWVDHFPYQDGLLISYWDDSQSDNNVSLHPGEGLILPIDSHPAPLWRPDGVPWRARIQTFDATFSRQRTDPITVHHLSTPWSVGRRPGVSVFDDNRLYWNPAIPTSSVMNPDTNTRITIKSVNANNVMTVEVRPTN